MSSWTWLQLPCRLEVMNQASAGQGIPLLSNSPHRTAHHTYTECIIRVCYRGGTHTHEILQISQWFQVDRGSFPKIVHVTFLNRAITVAVKPRRVREKRESPKKELCLSQRHKDIKDVPRTLKNTSSASALSPAMGLHLDGECVVKCVSNHAVSLKQYL